MQWTLVKHAPSSTPLKLAIIGSGPSAFYSAARVLSSLKNDEKAEVHLYERLPTPNGLVRYGVAPDHPEVKNVENKFAQVASDPRLRFFGNVDVVSSSSASSSSSPSDQYDYPDAHKLALSDLLPHYTHLLLAYGSSLARPLSLSASSTPLGVHSALDLVNWYNGHPASHDGRFLSQNPHRRIDMRPGMQHATIIGAGNVALDVARILLRGARGSADEGLAASDVPEPVLAHLADRLHALKQVDVVARRGAAQAAFTNKELREMMDLAPSTRFIQPSQQEMEEARRHVEALEQQGEGQKGQARIRKRLLSILDKGSGSAASEEERRWALRFFANPVRFASDADGRIAAVEWDRMAFKSPAASSAASASSPTEAPWSADQRGSSASAATTSATSLAPTGERFTTSTDLVITSVGYRGAPLSPPAHSPASDTSFSFNNEASIPWDNERGIVPNFAGRVVNSVNSDRGSSGPVPGMYVAGWLATGPVGVIASTRLDANTVADAILEDWRAQRPNLSSSSSSSSALLGEVPESMRKSSAPIVDWAGWTKLDEEERKRGKGLGKLREKVLSIPEMLNIAA